jgi:hypothetical protein
VDSRRVQTGLSLALSPVINSSLPTSSLHLEDVNLETLGYEKRPYLCSWGGGCAIWGIIFPATSASKVRSRKPDGSGVHEGPHRIHMKMETA